MVTLPPGLGVRVRVPASSANLGPGFDAIGLALGVWDDYQARVGGDGLRIEVSGQGADQVPRDQRHLVYRCLVRGLEVLGCAPPAGVELLCTNRVPHSRGMGSSATAAVAGFALACAWASAASGSAQARSEGAARARDDVPLDLDLINELAAQAEGHPDNSSASVYGGMTVSWSDDPGAMTGVHTARVAVHPDVVPLVLVPDMELSTAAARAALPTDLPLKAASLNAGRAALLVEAMTRDPRLLLPATRDWLHQEARRIAYPATMRVVDALRAQGAAAVVSGAGPTVLVLTTAADLDRDRALAEQVTSGESARWRVGTPGIPAAGVTASVA